MAGWAGGGVSAVPRVELTSRRCSSRVVSSRATSFSSCAISAACCNATTWASRAIRSAAASLSPGTRRLPRRVSSFSTRAAGGEGAAARAGWGGDSWAER